MNKFDSSAYSFYMIIRYFFRVIEDIILRKSEKYEFGNRWLN